MSRISRIVIPGIAHHVIQRGSRRLQTFFTAKDYTVYKRILEICAKKEGIEILAYCLMPNHVHFIAIPSSKKSFTKGFGEAHRQYSRIINVRNNWCGHLWQERFRSYPMDECHLYHAVKYVELNPVAARIVKQPQDYRWSSAATRLNKRFDELLGPKMIFAGIDWISYWRDGMADQFAKQIDRHTRSGRPCGSNEFIRMLEKISGRDLFLKKPGPPLRKSIK
jgi:putative transposase